MYYLSNNVFDCSFANIGVVNFFHNFFILPSLSFCRTTNYSLSPFTDFNWTPSSSFFLNRTTGNKLIIKFYALERLKISCHTIFRNGIPLSLKYCTANRSSLGNSCVFGAIFSYTVFIIYSKNSCFIFSTFVKR